MMLYIIPLAMVLGNPVGQGELPRLESWDMSPTGRLVPVLTQDFPRRDIEQRGSVVFERYEPHLVGGDFVSAHVALTLLFEPDARAVIREGESGFEGIFNDLQVRVDYREYGQKQISYPDAKRQRAFITTKWLAKLKLTPRTEIAKKSSIALKATDEVRAEIRGPMTNDRILWSTKWTAWYSLASNEGPSIDQPTLSLLDCLRNKDQFVAAHLCLGQRLKYKDFVAIPESYGFRVIADRLHVEIHVDAHGKKTVMYPDTEDQMERLQNLWARRFLLTKNRPVPEGSADETDVDP